MLNFLHDFLHNSRRNAGRWLAPWLCLLFAANAVWAKDIPITGILLFGDNGNMGYVQITGLLINGKTELLSCNGSGAINKSDYKKLAILNLSAVTALERQPDGTLMAEVNGARPACVVPGNFKYNKEGALEPKELAEDSNYTGQVIGSSDPKKTTLPDFPSWKKFIFGPTDKELAEYSLADHVNSIDSWQNYLKQYPSGTHLTEANTGLSALQQQAGQDQLAKYRASTTSNSPDYDALKNARDKAKQSHDVKPDYDAANNLLKDVRGEVKLLTDQANGYLDAFRDDVSKHVPGYSMLGKAKDLSDHISSVDPEDSDGRKLADAVSGEIKDLETTIQKANAQIASTQYDDAYATIGKYLSFAGEEPRLKQIVDETYQFHMKQGNAEVASSDWGKAIDDFNSANKIAATDETKTAINNARAKQTEMQNGDAADKARAVSKQHMDNKDAIGAYDAFNNLNDVQRSLVKDDIAALQDAYVQAVIPAANAIQHAHFPISGPADETPFRKAYDDLLRASKLSDNPSIGNKLGFIADTIANYYIGKATTSLSKPLSSGVGLGMAYLNEAAQYEPDNTAIRDAMTSNTAAYQMRSKLSIGVVFGDQTSYGDRYADQLEQAFKNNLETSGLPVKVILHADADPLLKPNYNIVGAILQHRYTSLPSTDTMKSEYNSTPREIPNPDYQTANAESIAAQSKMQEATEKLSEAQAKHDKKMIDAATADVNTARKASDQALIKRDALPPNTDKTFPLPYNYTKTTYEVTSIVELSFSIQDSDGNMIGEKFPPITKGDQPKTYIVYDGIKPEDTSGVKASGTAPEEKPIMTGVQDEATSAIVKAAQDRVQELPKKILEEARTKAKSNDPNGAAESYVLYLNCTPAGTTPERTEALNFLSENFNLSNTANLHAGAQ